MSNSVAIITGASQGIGKATALRLAKDFSSLTLVARDEARLQETAQQAKSLGAESLVLALDLRQPAAADKIVNDTLGRFGRIDALVNIAGAVPPNRSIRNDGRTVGRRHGAEVSRSSSPHHTSLGRFEGC
jgi:3-oxoacyl-[acyl-carrier protein] reductase